MSYDVIGNIAILKFEGEVKNDYKKRFAKKLLQFHPNIKTVLEKSERVKGRLRTIKTKYLAGEKTKEAEYKENGCVFKFDVEKCYFSPRLSEERKRITEKCKSGEKILVMFGGVAPFAIVIAKNKPQIKKIVSVELGKECSKYAKINVKLNKLEKKVETIQGDVKKVLPKLKKKKEIYDRIIMSRPNLKETFLKSALVVARKGTIIHYYGFCHENDKEKLIKQIREECEKNKQKIKILGITKAGDIAPRKFRYRVDFKIL